MFLSFVKCKWRESGWLIVSKDENPLDVSPADPAVSKQLGPEKDGGPENSAKGQKRSQSGHPRKHGEPGKNA